MADKISKLKIITQLSAKTNLTDGTYVKLTTIYFCENERVIDDIIESFGDRIKVAKVDIGDDKKVDISSKKLCLGMIEDKTESENKE